MKASSIVGILVLVSSACGGSSASSVLVTREGRGSESYGAVHFTCTNMGSAAAPAMDCNYGDAASGLQVMLLFSHAISGLAAGTTLEQGTDFDISALTGGTDGSSWGASGPTAWWAGNLALTLGSGGSAVLDGTAHTTDAVAAEGLIPITVMFSAVAADLPQ